MQSFLTVLLMIVSLVIVIAVTMQDPKTEGLGSLGGTQTNVFGRSAHKSKNETLDKVVVVGGVLLFLLSIILLAVQ